MNPPAFDPGLLSSFKVFARHFAVAAALSTLVVAPTMAVAQPQAMMSDPKPGEVLTASPTAIRMIFTERLTRRSGVKLSTSDGEGLATLPASIGGPDNTRLVVPLLAPLSPGVYIVSWQAFSDSAHRARGKYKFEIAP